MHFDKISRFFAGIVFFDLLVLFGWLVLVWFFYDTFLDKLQNLKDRSEFASLGDDKIFESPESYMYACVYMLAFKYRNLGVCFEAFALGNLTQYKEKCKIVENHME